MPLTRHQNWDTRHLDKFLRDNENVSFQWGVADCCLFAANAIESFTGIDIAADDFRSKYHDEASAFALIKSVTGGTTVLDAAAYCANKHGLREHAYPLMAKRGDLAVIQNGSSFIAGVVHLNGRHVISVGPKGLVRLPISKVVRSWGV